MREARALARRPPVGPLRLLVDIAEVAAEAVVRAGRFEHRARRLRLGDHGRAAGAEDAGFLAPDRLAIGSEIIDMVDADAGEHGAIGIDDVHRVEPPAQPHLEHRGLDRLARE